MQSEKLTILQIIPALNSGGAERGAVDIAIETIRAGGRAVIVSEGGRLTRELIQAGGEHITVPVASKSPIALWKNRKILEEIIKKTGADLVHARSRAPAWSAFYAAKAARVPFVTTYHGLYGEKSFLKRFYNKIMVSGEAVIAVSHYIADNIALRYPEAKHKIHVIERGIDIRHFSPELITRQRMEGLIKQWKLADDMRYVITLPARITRIKGHHLLFEAVKELLKIRNDFVCVCPGDVQEDKGRYAAELLEKIRTQGLDTHIRFPGMCLDMPAAYAASNVVTVPTLKPEAFGRVPVEAQVMGKIVVAARHGGLTETIEDGVTGFLFTPGDPVDMARALNEALNCDEEQRRKMAVIGKERALQKYTGERMSNATLNLYEKIIGKKFLNRSLLKEKAGDPGETTLKRPNFGSGAGFSQAGFMMGDATARFFPKNLRVPESAN